MIAVDQIKNSTSNDSFSSGQGISKTFFQPKLTINNPNDQYEQEADAMADKVMRMEQPFIQKKPFPISPVQRKCTHCEEEEKKAQRKEKNNSETTADASFENYVGTLNSGGQSLPNEVRNFYEPRFGYDFSNVKIHNDTVAAKSAQSINALAYTSGNNIIFNEGQYSLNTDNGKKLLGHELTHVVQQAAVVQTKSIQRKTHPPKRKDCDRLDDYIRLIVVNQETPQTVTIFWNYSGNTETATCSAGKGNCCIDDMADDNVVGANQASSTTGSSGFTPVGTRPVQKIINLGEDDGRRYWTEFDDPRDIALHAYPRFDGTPLSHGCVRMGVEMAKQIYCGSIENKTKVEVRGFARPRCSNTALQNEWFLDFTEAATLPDGKSADARRSISSTRRILKRLLHLGNDARGEAALNDILLNLVDKVAQGITLENVKAAIPRCTDISGLGIEEERLQRVDQSLLNQTFIEDFRKQLGNVASLTTAITLMDTEGLELWNQSHATFNQKNQPDVDDRKLYWTRNFVIREIHEWKPLFRIASSDKESLIQHFESASRGLTQTTFTAGPGVKKILITGFDSFGMPASGNITTGNPSGAVVLSLDGQTIKGAHCDVLIKGAVFPVRYNDFDQGIVENYVSNFLKAGNEVDMIITISLGNPKANPVLPYSYELERWAGRVRRGGTDDNSGKSSAQTDLQHSLSGRYGAQGSSDEFIESTLPVNSMRKNNAALFDRTYEAIDASGNRINQTNSSVPPAGSTAAEGSGGDFLSNEIFYRVRLLQINQSPKSTIPMGHLHIPGNNIADYPLIVGNVRTILTNAVDFLCPGI